jgi:hypothetical protein
LNDVLNSLVADLRPTSPRRPVVEAGVVAGLCLAELLVWLLMKQARPDLMHAMMTTPALWWKLISFGLIAALALATTVASLDPSVSPRLGLGLIVLAILAYLAVGAVMSVPVGETDIVRRLNWREGEYCLSHAVPLSAPVMIGLGYLMKRAAPTRLVATSAAAGVTAAAWGAFVFTFNCTQDDFFYVMVWYTFACVISTAIALALLPRLARW